MDRISSADGQSYFPDDTTRSTKKTMIDNYRSGFVDGIKAERKKPSPTDPAFCWRALQYMMGREDWVLFDNHAYGIWWKAEHEMDSALYIKWLLSDPARFIDLADEWCREHKEVKA